MIVQEYKDTRIHGYKDTRIQRYKDTRIQGYKDTRIQGYKSNNGSIQIARPVREQLFARTVVTRSYLAHMRTVVTRSYDII